MVFARLNAKAFFTLPDTASVTHKPLPNGRAELETTSETKLFSTALCCCNLPALMAVRVSKLCVSISKLNVSSVRLKASLLPNKIARNFSTSVNVANCAAVSSSPKTCVN